MDKGLEPFLSSMWLLCIYVYEVTYLVSANTYAYKQVIYESKRRKKRKKKKERKKERKRENPCL